MSLVRAAMTQTVNAYSKMPASRDELSGLSGKLDEIREANLDHHSELIRAASEAGAKVIGLGELFPYPYFGLSCDPVWHGFAEDPEHGPSVVAMRGAAKRNGIVVVAPIYEKSGEERFNTAVVIDEKGEILGRYRKTHIPKGSNEQGTFDEAFYYSPSRVPQNESVGPLSSHNPHFPVFKTSVGKIGVAICYDRHFPGTARSLAAGGAEIVFSPAVTFGDKSRRMWQHEFLVDACRWRLFIGGSNRKGEEAPWNQEFFGESYFAGPDGSKLENLSKRPELVISDLDLAGLRKPDPAGWALERDRRPEIYSPDAP